MFATLQTKVGLSSSCDKGADDTDEGADTIVYSKALSFDSCTCNLQANNPIIENWFRYNARRRKLAESQSLFQLQ